MKSPVNNRQSWKDISSLSKGDLMHIAKKAMLMFAFIFLCGIAVSNAQERARKNPLAGLWQYVDEKIKEDGQKVYIGKQIYKTITADDRYFVMLGINIPLKEADSEKTEMSTVTFITQQGEIEMTSGNSYLEYINNHYLDKSLNNTISNLRYRFNEQNPNILYIEYNLGGNENENWVSEVWLKVMPYGL